MAVEKPPENYYSLMVNWFSITFYFGLMTTIFLSFGFIRKKRMDKKKVKGFDNVEEMMDSFGLHYFMKEQLLTITKSFNSKLRTQLNDKEDIRTPLRPQEIVSKESYFGWVSDLWAINSEEIRHCCGLEAYLYLTFVKRSA